MATLSESDAENTFILLTIQECPDLQAKLITIINKDEIEKISRLRPDMLLSLADRTKEGMMKEILLVNLMNSSDHTVVINKYFKIILCQKSPFTEVNCSGVFKCIL